MAKTNKPLFTASEEMKSEYCAKIVRIGEMKPIEGSDFLVQTYLDGESIVISKGEFTVGEPVIYCMNETKINKDFLSVNNQFEIGCRDMNANFKEVEQLVMEGKNDEAKKKVGFFNKHGRVRLIRLRGCPSYGCIFKKETLAKWIPKVADEDLESYFVVDENGYEHPFEFDTVGGKLFADVYVPPMPPERGSGDKHLKKRMKRLKRFDRMVPGQFSFHYDTGQLTSNMWRFSPDDVVTISVKLHGTSSINGNILTKIPLQLGKLERIMMKRALADLKKLDKQTARQYWQKAIKEKQRNRLKSKIPQTFKFGYGPVYSSRGVIKNQYINKEVGSGFYNVDIWTEYGELLKPFITEGFTVYSEICGYVTGSQKMIQKQYDYGCEPGNNFIMPYRIVFTDAEGNKTEWEVEQVYGWTLNLIKQHPEIADRVHPIDILYHGTLGDLYPTIDRSEHWHENVLEAMRNDKEHFGMELNEPLCKTKVPREGIVIRIDGDEKAEAFKLKTDAFKFREQKLVDSGEVDDEMAQGYGN